MKKPNRLIMFLSVVLATVSAHAGPLVIGLAEDGTLGRLDLTTLRGELGRRVEQRDMTVPAQVAVVRMTPTGEPRAIGGFDGSCSLVDAERFRDGTADRTANDSTREVLKSAGALVRVADQYRIALRFVSICVVTERAQDYAGLLKLPAPGFVARAEGAMAYLVLPGGLVMFTL